MTEKFDLMHDLEGIPAYALDQLKNAEYTGEGIKLPFPALYAHVLNGDPKQKAAAKTAPALYFGGFATDATKAGQLVEDGVIPSLPDGWVAFEGVGEKGNWDGLCARTITIARIGSRERWLNSEGVGYAHYKAEQGFTRRHLQMLCLLYSKGTPLGYAVITAKGFQAKYLMDSLAAWKTAISKFAKELNASQIPLGGFAVSLGTVGDAPDYVSVGKTATSKITPITAVIPADLSAEKVGKRFIGAQNLTANAERLEMAAEWLGAWTKREQPAEAEREEAVEDPNW